MATATEEKQPEAPAAPKVIKNCQVCGNGAFVQTALPAGPNVYAGAEYCTKCGIVRVKVPGVK